MSAPEKRLSARIGPSAIPTEREVFTHLPRRQAPAPACQARMASSTHLDQGAVAVDQVMGRRPAPSGICTANQRARATGHRGVVAADQLRGQPVPARPAIGRGMAKIGVSCPAPPSGRGVDPSRRRYRAKSGSRLGDPARARPGFQEHSWARLALV